MEKEACVLLEHWIWRALESAVLRLLPSPAESCHIAGTLPPAMHAL